MISEPDTKRCASKETEPRKGWTRGNVPARTLGPEGVEWRVPHQLEKGMSASENTGP